MGEESAILNQEGLWSSPRPISTAKLDTLPCLHMQPISLALVYRGLTSLRCRISNLDRLHAAMLSALSVPHIVAQLYHWRGAGAPEYTSIPVSRTRTALLKYPAPTTDGTELSRRSEPSSRTTLIGEQPNADRIQPQDVMEGRHQCQTSPSMWTLGEISLYPRAAFSPLSDSGTSRFAGSPAQSRYWTVISRS